MIDSHCHLDFKQYQANREEVIREALDAGVKTIINIGTDLSSSELSVELSRKFDSIRAVVGVHPHDASTVNDRVLNSLRELAKNPRVVAIGEIGLDFYRDLSPRDIQRKAFRKQLELAVECRLPIVIHTRESFAETLQIVREYAGDLKGGVFHCFPGDIEEANQVIEISFMVSFGGIITFPRARMADVAAEAEIGSVLLETDAPFLTPVPYRGKTNRPAYVRYVYRKFAELRGLPLVEIEKQIDRNCQKFFGLVETFGE